MLWVCLLAGLLNYEPVIEEHVDRVEINHCFNEQGNFKFTQVIFYRWDNRVQDWLVVDWRWHKDAAQVRKDRRGGFVVVWVDREQLRRVFTPIVQETWTTYDPEVQARYREQEFHQLPPRRGLRMP